MQALTCYLQRWDVIPGSLPEEGLSLSPFVICNHLERVKSFAPKVDHLVADVFIGFTLPLEIKAVIDRGLK